MLGSQSLARSGSGVWETPGCSGDNCQQLFFSDIDGRSPPAFAASFWASWSFPREEAWAGKAPHDSPCHLTFPTFLFKVVACFQLQQPQVFFLGVLLLFKTSLAPPPSTVLEFGASWGILKGKPGPPQMNWLGAGVECDPGALNTPWASFAHFPSSLGKWVPYTAAVGVVGAGLGDQPDIFPHSDSPGCFG